MGFFEKTGKLKAITFSYDDGVTQDVQLVELMNKYGLKGTFNLNSERIGTRGIITRVNKLVSYYKLFPEDVKRVYEGHEVAAHTLNHPLLPGIEDDGEIIRQVEQDRLNLSELMGYEVVGFAYPGGGKNYDERVADLIKNNTGIKYARTTVDTDSFDLQSDLFMFKPNVYHVMNYDRLMEMGKNFLELETDKPQIFYVWGHSYEIDYYSERWEKLEEFFNLISNRDDIFYGTNKDVLL
ncbi:MAG: polysaccharide deacetylase family protein [Clostridia bacterium]|nr:polysaccharide deacetylase family protein [Clostridia bacterium]